MVTSFLLSRSVVVLSVYRGEFTTAGKILGKFAGGRKLTMGVLKEWFYYFFQCTECRRCSVFCPCILNIN